MTSAVLTFRNYPLLIKGKPKLFSGSALVKLAEHLTLQDEKSGIILVPAQRILKWTIERLELDKSQKFDEADLERFVRGRYWPQVERLLYAQFCHEKGRPDLARAFER